MPVPPLRHAVLLAALLSPALAAAQKPPASKPSPVAPVALGLAEAIGATVVGDSNLSLDEIFVSRIVT